MKNLMVAFVASSLALLAGSASAAERCRFVGMQWPGSTVLVRHPLPDPVPDPGEPATHTNKHVVWLVDREQATFIDELGFEDPAVIAVGDFVPGGTCDMVWEGHASGQNGSTRRLVVGEGFTEVEGDAFANGTEAPPEPWQIAGASDFTDDGWSDLFWWNPDTGGLLFWNRTPAANWQPTAIVGGLPKPWRPVAVALLEPFGPPGVIWFNPSKNPPFYYQRTEWAGQYLQLQAVGDLGLGDPGWAIVAVGDFDGDGKEDLMRQEQGAPFGRLQVCFMNGLALRECTALDPERLQHPYPEYQTLAWYVVGPR